MISGQMSPINSSNSVLESVIKVHSVNNSSLGHYDIHEDFPNKAMDIDLDDDSDLQDLMSRVERVGRDSDDEVQTEAELAPEEPLHDDEDVDSNHDDKSRAVSDDSNDHNDTSDSAHTFDSAATIKLDCDAEMPVIRAEDVTTLAEDEQFTEQSGQFTEQSGQFSEELQSSSVHEPAKGDDFAWNLDASSDNLLGESC